MAHKNILALIPARGGSKGIPGKNLAKLCGAPLIQYTIDAAKNSTCLSRIILSSDDERIIEYCQTQGIEVPFIRPAELASDDSAMIEVVMHALDFFKKNEAYKPAYVVLLQPTSPLRTARHIDEAVRKLQDSEADSVVSVVEVPHSFSPHSVMEFDGKYVKPFQPFDEHAALRQKKPKFYGRNGPAVLACRGECLMKKKSMYGEKIVPYVMRPEESVDIDTEFDMLCAEAILKKKQ